MRWPRFGVEMNFWLRLSLSDGSSKSARMGFLAQDAVATVAELDYQVLGIYPAHPLVPLWCYGTLPNALRATSTCQGESRVPDDLAVGRCDRAPRVTTKLDAAALKPESEMCFPALIAIFETPPAGLMCSQEGIICPGRRTLEEEQEARGEGLPCSSDYLLLRT